jgi:cytochrome c-type biogenesis protein CcmF
VLLAYLPGVRKGPGRPWLGVARKAVYLNAAGLVACAGYLWYLILTHQYQFDYVARYSSNDMPLRYIIASFWGGQEGTFLLWALYGGLLALFLRFKAKQYEAPVLFFYLGINMFLLLMLLKASPFKTLATVPVDGNGLNPLLQDPWMTIHPPVMFFGFASLGIPAAYAMAALVKEDWDNWVRRAVPWTIFGIMALGTGLVMGGYWAYSILGWGGFWGWDPVENSSLVPWLMGVALLHSQVIQMKRGIFKRTNILLSMFPFLLLTYSTFLTRSGVLADFSVHSFTDLGINQFLAAFILVFLIGGLGLFAFKFRRIPTAKAQAPLASREYFMFLGALSFGLFAVFVLLGTSAPLLTRITGNPSNVQPEFYNRMGLPFAILVTLLLATAPFLIWNKANLKATLRQLVWPFFIALSLAGFLFGVGVHHPGYLAILFTAAFAALSNFKVVAFVMRRKLSSAGGFVAHIGIGLAVLGIISSTAFNQKETVVLPKGEEVLALGYGFSYMGPREVEHGRKNAYDVKLRTADGVHVMSPTMFFSDFNAGMMKKPAIRSFWARDVYLSPIAHVTDPLEDRILSTFMLAKGQPQPFMGMDITLLGVEEGSVAPSGHNHAMSGLVGRIQFVDKGGKTTVAEAVLATGSDGKPQSIPVAVGDTGLKASLIAVDLSRTTAKVGVELPPVVLSQGESAEVDGAVIAFDGFELEESSRRGGTVKIFAVSRVSMGGNTFPVRPGLISRPNAENLELVEAPVGRTGLNLVLQSVDSQKGKAYFQLTTTPQEYLYAEASLKPFIGLLWVGTVLMVLGLAIATAQRGRLANRLSMVGDQEARAKKNGKRAAA